MGSRGQSTRGGVAHHHAGSTSAFRQLATEGEAQFVSRSTFEGPCTSSIGCEEGSGPYSPEEQDFFHPSGDHCSGPDPDPAILSSLKDALQRAKESSKPSPNLHTGKSPDARVAEAQARVSRLQAAVDLLGVDNPDAELLKASLEAAKRQCRVQLVGERLDSCLKFVERAQGRVERQKRIVEEAQQVLANYESQLARVARSGTIACRSTRMSCSATDTQRAGERNHRIAGIALGSGTIEERTEPMDGEDQQFSGHGSCRGFSLQPDGKFDQRSRREAPLCRACVMRQHVECAEWQRSVHSRYGLRGVSESRGGQPPRSRFPLFCSHRDGHRCGG